MTSAFVLIFSVLILGGIIAALGDRLGSKVGKARLRLFNLRPKQTAVVVTVITGTLISATTLGLLFGLSKSLRQGVFQLDKILAQRREELAEVSAAKKAIETELGIAKQDQLTAQTKLKGTEKKFAIAQTELEVFKAQSTKLRQEIKGLTGEQTELKKQRDELQTQSDWLQTRSETLQAKSDMLQTRSETLQTQVKEQDGVIQERAEQIQSLESQQNELQQEIDSRDAVIDRLDGAIASKDEVLSNLENQIVQLDDQINILQANYSNFRSGNVALTTGQVLAFGVVRIIKSNAVNQALDELLREANRNAIIATRGVNPDLEERVVQITNDQAQQLIAQISDGQDYVVRLLSAANYIQGESEVQVFADAVLNERVFRVGEIIATLSLEELNLQNPTAARRPVDFLLGAAQFRARRSGILGDIQVRDGHVSHIIDFVNAMNRSLEPITEIRAIALGDGFKAGPLRLELVGLNNGKIVIRK